jgi:hypothetical protein
MDRKLKLVLSFLAASVVLGGVAAAASSPTISTGSATSIRSSSALLRGTINPNGASTTYRFFWGLAKNAYTAASPAKSAGHGTTAGTVSFRATGLLPGTVYHFTLAATNRFGTATGADRAFKTSGHPPPDVATAGVAQLSANAATLTGVVNPRGEATTYFFQYGTTTGYGAQTAPLSVPAGGAAVSVAQTITGLAQYTTFHYRLVAQHGTVRSYGLDQSFVTFASPKIGVGVGAGTRPRHDHVAPYPFTTTGRVHLPSNVPASLGCAGSATVEFFLGRRSVSFSIVPIQPNCLFINRVVFHHLPGRGKKHRTVTLRVRITFSGNGYVARTRARLETVLLGGR